MNTGTKKKATSTMKVNCFAAFQDEWDKWREKAKAQDRTLSSFIRLRMLAADARDEELAPPLKVE